MEVTVGEKQLLILASKIEKGEAKPEQIIKLMENKNNALTSIKHPKILKIATKNGYTVAHEAAHHHSDIASEIVEKHPELLTLKTKDGLSVAHKAALHKPAALELLRKRPEVLKLTNKTGETVAQVIANTLDIEDI